MVFGEPPPLRAEAGDSEDGWLSHIHQSPTPEPEGARLAPAGGGVNKPAERFPATMPNDGPVTRRPDSLLSVPGVPWGRRSAHRHVPSRLAEPPRPLPGR